MFHEHKNDCAIVGLWTANNYGSVLTAWSLYNIIKKIGKHPVLVDHTFSTNRGTIIGRFIRERCETTHAYSSSAEMMELNQYIETYIVGADQNWADAWINWLNGYSYFLDFADDSKKKISYSTSFGHNEFIGTAQELEIVKTYLRRFDAISLREKNAAELWSRILEREIPTVIDPVFFTSKDEYLKLANDNSANKEEQVMLQFILELYPELLSTGKELAYELNLRYKLFLGPDYVDRKNIGIEWDINGHPVEEFLSAIATAKYVVTDSFHVMCFCLIFHKPFLAIANCRGRARIESLLDVLGLDLNAFYVEPELFQANHCVDIISQQHIAWDEIDRKLNEWRAMSLAWLEGELQREKELISTDWKLLAIESVNLATVANRELENYKQNVRYQIEHANKMLTVCWNEIEHLKTSAAKARGARLKKFLADNLKPNQAIAIRGGGDHTEKLLDLLDQIISQYNLDIKYIADMSSKLQISVPKGCVLIKPDDLWNNQLDVDVVILSSSKYKKEFFAEANERNSEKYQIINPYDAFERDELQEMQGWYD